MKSRKVLSSINSLFGLKHPKKLDLRNLKGKRFFYCCMISVMSGFAIRFFTDNIWVLIISLPLLVYSILSMDFENKSKEEKLMQSHNKRS